MDLTLIGRSLRQHPLLLALGVVAALVAGFFSGYTYSSDGVQPRTPPVYRGSSTVILTNPTQSIFAAEVPPASAEGAEGVAPPQSANLAQLAMVYAWVISGDQIRSGTEQVEGPLAADERLTAQRRTTQPTGSEQFGGSAGLPIIDIVTGASSATRAEEIAQAATDVFLDYVVQQQEASGIPPEQRVLVSVLRSPSSELTDGGSSLVSGALVGAVVLLVFLLLIVYRTNARQVRSARAAAPVGGAGPDVSSRGPRRRMDGPWDVDVTEPALTSRGSAG